MASRVVPVQQFNLYCDENVNLPGDAPPPLTPQQLAVQLTDAECAWYFGIHQAIGQEFSALLSDPRYAPPPPAGAKAYARYLIIGPENHQESAVIWSGLAVGEGRQLPGLGVWGDGRLALFVKAALSGVNERHRPSLALLPQWTKRLEPIKATDGRRVLRGVLLESEFKVDPLALNQHMYNVACLQWIRENVDPKAVEYPGAKPWKFALR